MPAGGAAALAACMGEYIAHEVDAAALPSGVEHLGDGAFDALMGVRDDELNPTQVMPLTFQLMFSMGLTLQPRWL